MMYRIVFATMLLAGCTLNVTNTNPKIGIGEKATVKTEVKAATSAAPIEVKPEPSMDASQGEVPAAEPSVPSLANDSQSDPRPKGPCYVRPYAPEHREECEKYGHNEDGWGNPHELPSPSPTPAGPSWDVGDDPCFFPNGSPKPAPNCGTATPMPSTSSGLIGKEK